MTNKLFNTEGFPMKKVIVLFLLFFSLTLYHLPITQSTDFPPVKDFSFLDLVNSAPILIVSDDDFLSLNIDGSGTEEDPYVIENINVTRQESTGINIRNTSKYFIIRNNFVKVYSSCIVVYNISEGTAIIENNVCEHYRRYGISSQYSKGIYVAYANKTIVRKNICEGSEYGIRISKSFGVVVEENECGENLSSPIITELPITRDIIDGMGILVSHSPNSSVLRNYCIENGEFGIGVFSSNSTIIKENSCYANGYFSDNPYVDEEDTGGILIYGSSNVLISDNLCENNELAGLRLTLTTNSTISNNSFNDLLYGMVIKQSSSIEIIQNEILNGGYGADFSECSDCEISYNLFQEQSQYAVSFANSNDSVIHHNSFAYNNGDDDSQGFDEGYNNTWFQKSTLEGNWWSNLGRDDVYTIDGDANAVDLYPLEKPPIKTKFHLSIELYQIVMIVAIVIAIGVAIYGLGQRQKRKATELNPPYDLSDVEKTEYIEKLAGNFCPSCGKQLSEVETFCSKCGVQVK